MSTFSDLHREEQDALQRRAASGDAEARGALLAQHREPLRRAVERRLDARIRQRVDPSDVVQEASMDALRRFDDYLRNPAMRLYPWLLFLALQQLQAAHRKHLGARQRDVRREANAGPGLLSATSSVDLAARLIAGQTSPSQAAMRREGQERLQAALDQLDPLDREVIALRHVEQLRNVEVAQFLDITPSAATKRYLRGMERLREIVKSIPGYSEA